MFAAFQEAGAGILAAIDGQRALHEQPWPAGVEVRVRMGLHTGEAHLAGDDYGGFEVDRAARIAAAGHGGQIVVSATTRSLVESGLPPGVQLRDLGRHALRDIPAPEQLFQLDVPSLPHDFPPLRLVRASDGNLPDRLTTFIGREAELSELETLIDPHRLVTLIGPGGIGKTSLAIELARSRAPRMPDGAWLVPLDDVTDAGLVMATIARTLGLFDGVERPAAEALPAFLADRSMLLVLDNFEHLLDAASEVVALVRMSPSSRIVVTSRAPLHLGGEQEYPVRPLSVGGGADPDEPALDAAPQLFVDRARAVRPDWEPGPDMPIVVEICALLDGLPLGIELAAARLSLLPPAAIRDRLAARLPLPGSGPRDAPTRQRTLEGAIGWSHDLLTPAERSALHAVAVFEGGFDVAQAEQVIGVGDASASPGEALDHLLALGEHSLIARDQAPIDAARLAGTGIRFDLLQTVQGYALGRLAADGAEREARRRHAGAYVELAEEAAQHLFAAEQPAWLDRLTLDESNLRAALRWTIDEGETDLALRLVAALWRYWQVGGHLAEGSAWAEAALVLPGAEAPTPARLWALGAAGGIAYWRSEHERSVAHYREQLQIAEQIRDTAGKADAWFNLASAVYVAGDPIDSEHAIREARRLYVELGDERGANRVDWGMTNLIMERDGPAAMLAALAPVQARAAALGDAVYLVLVGGSMAWGNYMLGNFTEAARWGIQSMLASYGLRDVAGSSIALPIAAIVGLEVGLIEEAAVIMGAFEGLCERYGVRPPLGLEQLLRTTDPTVRLQSLLEPATLAAALDRGRRMSIDEAMDLVVHIGDAVPAGDQPAPSEGLFA